MLALAPHSPQSPVAWWLLCPWTSWEWGAPRDSSLRPCKKGNLLAPTGQGAGGEEGAHLSLENSNDLCFPNDEVSL